LKRVDIKTGFVCNNNCIFCVQADNKCKGNRSLDEIKKNLDECKDRCEGVVFTGGEVTVRKDFFEMVSYAKELGYKVIQIQSNGRMFSSLEFCKKTIEAGATEFSPALHGYCAEQHDYLTEAPGSFRQTVKGIKNLKSLGVYVLTNSVVVKSNYRDVPKIAQLLVSLDVDQFQFAFVHAMGNAMKNFDSVVPVMSLAVPYIKKGLQIGIDAGKLVMAESIPFCLMEGYEDYVAENFIPETEIRGKKFQNTDDFTSQRRNLAKMKFPQCKECKYDDMCEGPWREYPEKKGFDEFKVVIDNDSKLSKCNIQDETGKSLGKIDKIIKFMEKVGFKTEDYYISDIETYALVNGLAAIPFLDLFTNKIDIKILNDRGFLTKNKKSKFFKNEIKNKIFLDFMSTINLSLEFERRNLISKVRTFSVFDKVLNIDKFIIKRLIKHYKYKDTNVDLLKLTRSFLQLPSLDDDDLIVDLKKLEKILSKSYSSKQVTFSNKLSGTSLIKKDKKIIGIVNKNYKDCKMEDSIFVSNDSSAQKITGVLNSTLCIFEKGSKISHASSICRELGKDCIFGAKNVMNVLHEGDKIEANLNDGSIKILSRKCSLSLIMIVKDEDNKIDQCLRNIYLAFDEIIIVDTGSKDNTKKIAESYGAKVFDFEWCNDFSSARNFALSKCTSDWILILDADEVIEPNQINEIRNLINITKKDAFLLNNIEINKNYITGECKQDKVIPQGKVVRLFRNLPHLKYKGKIFEAVYCNPNDTGITFYHYKDISRKHKTDFYMKMCEKAYAENKSDPEIFLCLLQFYLMKSDFEKMKDIIITQLPIEVKHDINYFKSKLSFIRDKLIKNDMSESSEILGKVIKFNS